MDRQLKKRNRDEPEAVIQVREVHKSFKAVHAVKGISMNILPGQFVALLGPNGAGKTTMVEMIEGIQNPDEGEILIMENPGKVMKKNSGKIIGLSYRRPVHR